MGYETKRTDYVMMDERAEGYLEFPEDIQKRIENGIGCGAHIGKGWLPIVVKLNEQLSQIVPEYAIDQIKEKFGGLRFYTNVQDPIASKLIHEAEDQSYETCEICGEPGTTSGKGWIVTRCEIHKRDR